MRHYVFHEYCLNTPPIHGTQRAWFRFDLGQAIQQVSRFSDLFAGTTKKALSQMLLVADIRAWLPLGGRCQAPLVLQIALHPLEYHAIDDVSDSDNQEHDRNNGAHVVQVAPHHEHLTEAKTEVQHFGG